MNDVLKILLIGAAAYVAWILYEQYASASTSAATPSGTAPATAVPATLSISDIANFPYSSSLAQSQLQSLSPQLDQSISSGRAPSITCNSVAAYMLGWGCSTSYAKGATKTASGQTYVYDGVSTWNLQTSGVSGLGAARNYIFVGRRVA